MGRLASMVDAEPGFTHRPVIIFAYSYGCLSAYGLAQRLGSRLKKLYILARRPPHMPLLDEVWGVASGKELAALPQENLLEGLLHAWPNSILEQGSKSNPPEPVVFKVLDTVRRQYSSPCAPCGIKDLDAVGLAPVGAPIMAIACSKEMPAGETSAKMEEWKEYTSSSFEMATVDSHHLECLQPAGGDMETVYDIFRRDVQTLL